MTIAEQINAGLCSYGEILGTEISKSCISQITKMRASWYIAPGEEFRAGETFEDELSRLILAEKLIIVPQVETTSEIGNEDNEDASDSGIEQTTQEGLYKWDILFKNGMYFNRAMKTTLEGYKRWNHIWVTKDGLWGTKTTTGGLTGFTTGQIKTKKLVLGTSTTSQMEGQTIQYINRDELDVDFAFIPNKTAYKTKGVTEVLLSYVNAPSNSDTTLTVKAVLAQNQSEPFTGIDYTKFLHTENAVASNPTAGDDSATTGTFLLTVAALATNDETTLRLGSGSSKVITGADGDYYRSNLLEATVVV